MTDSKPKGPPSRANARLSNLIYQGGKSQSYHAVQSEPKDVPTAEPPAHGEHAPGRSPAN